MTGRSHLMGLVLVLVLLLAGRWTAEAETSAIDHYILALSWSPSFCASPEAEGEPLQCGGSRRFAFVVHGLWPQARSRALQYCRAEETWVPEEQIEEMLPIMPSRSLIIHQWKKHGACSAQSMRDYFDLVETLFRKVKVPARYLSPLAPVTIAPQTLLSDFVKTNKNLSADMMAIVCRPRSGRGRLTELRICFSPAGQFTQCRSRRRSDCTSETLLLPPVRGKVDLQP